MAILKGRRLIWRPFCLLFIYMTYLHLSSSSISSVLSFVNPAISYAKATEESIYRKSIKKPKTPLIFCFPNTLYERRFFLFFFCHFILSFLSIVLTVLKICFHFNIFFEIIQNIILSELKPKHIYARASRIQFFNSPPRPITSKDAFDEWTIISFSYI